MKKALALLALLLYVDIAYLDTAAAQVNTVPAFGNRDTTGSAFANFEGQKASYFVGLGANTPAATPTDIAIITGSSTKTIKVTRVRLTVQATASGIIQFDLVKRVAGTQSAVNTVFVTATHGGLMDSQDAASTMIAAGIAGVYTSNAASLGTLSGILASWTTALVANTTTQFIWECTLPSKCPTLRGTTQILAINGAGHTLLTGEKVGVAFEYTEE